MATRKATPLDADLIARKGETAPAQIPTPPSPPAASVPHGTKDTVALTVRLDHARYRGSSRTGRNSPPVRPIRRSWSRPSMPISIRWRNDVLTYKC
jgi:hypothetical protein